MRKTIDSVQYVGAYDPASDAIRIDLHTTGGEPIVAMAPADVILDWEKFLAFASDDPALGGATVTAEPLEHSWKRHRHAIGTKVGHGRREVALQKIREEERGLAKLQELFTEGMLRRSEKTDGQEFMDPDNLVRLILQLEFPSHREVTPLYRA
jgi:hypothetical protein